MNTSPHRILPRNTLVALALLSSSAIISPVHAHHVSAPAPSNNGGPINTISADTLKKGAIAFGIQSYTENYDEFSNEALEGFAGAGIEGVHNTDAAYIASLTLEYGVTNDFSLGVTVPYVLRYGIREGELEDGVPEAHILGDARGIGDVVINAKYRVLNRAEDDLSLAFLAGLKTPTGDSRERTISDDLFEVEFQPGTGSWNPYFGLAAGKNIGGFSVDGNIRYSVATEGDQQTNLGDDFTYNLGLSYRLGKGAHTHDDGKFERHHALDLIVELNGEWSERERVGAELDFNSGGTQLFVSPGLRYSSPQGWNTFLSVGFPIYEDLNGIQNDTDVRGTFGIGVNF